ncbi:lysostaphin resistance A-like protein [Tepidicaulis sp. LMO-SS28]|uniref:CPBP family intramembrane glutamic endopeptidase n=1 Tax=Tepidicaulis sp. LMO-SS28 TaxID=3447455 RepID=UPI003EE0F9B6
MTPIWPAPPGPAHPDTQPDKEERETIPSPRAVRAIDIFIIPAATALVLGLGFLASHYRQETGIPDLLPQPAPAWTAHAVAAALYGTMLAAAFALLLWRRVPLAEAGFRRVAPGWAALTLAVWTVYIALFGALNLWVNSDGFEMIEEQNRLILEGANLLLSLFVLGVLAPIAEEIYFRGILFGWLKRHLGALVSALLTSLFFALVHTNYLMDDMIATLLALAQIGTLGFLAALLYQRTGSLLPAILLHMTNNLAVTLITAAAA